MPTIRHRAGPLAGQEQTIDPRAERIMFGRDPAVCDVVFPPDQTLVARRHFALVRKPSGEWLVEDFGDPFVSVNGHAAEPDERVPSGAIIELGKKGGPSFEVLFEGKGLDDALPATAIQQKAPAARQAAARARNLALAGVAVAAAFAIGGGAFMYFNRSDGAKLEQAVAALQKAQDQAAADSITAPVRDRLVEASHVVVLQFPGGEVTATGTASPVGPDLLVTNAHVAELRDRAVAGGGKLFVRSPGPNGKTYEVIETKLHPGYRAFQAFLSKDPIYVTSVKACPNCFPSELQAVTSYDVALMRVAPGSNLSPILEVATTEELHNLRPGQVLALAGYPTERIRGSEMQALTATPNYRAGVVSAITDMFSLPGDIDHRRQILHNIAVTGGNSGSPMIAANGKIVGLLNAGNVLAHGDGGRMPNAAIINYGQRADLARELMDGTAEANLERERAYWTRQTAAFQRGFDYLVPRILAETGPAKAGKPAEVAQTKFTLTTGDQYTAKDPQGKDIPRRQKIHRVTMKANAPGIFIAYAERQTQIQMYLVINGQIVQQDERRIWFPFLRYSYPQDTTAEIYVVGPASDVNYTLLQYSWEPPKS